MAILCPTNFPFPAAGLPRGCLSKREWRRKNNIDIKSEHHMSLLACICVRARAVRRITIIFLGDSRLNRKRHNLVNVSTLTLIFAVNTRRRYYVSTKCSVFHELWHLITVISARRHVDKTRNDINTNSTRCLGAKRRPDDRPNIADVSSLIRTVYIEKKGKWLLQIMMKEKIMILHIICVYL